MDAQAIGAVDGEPLAHGPVVLAADVLSVLWVQELVLLLVVPWVCLGMVIVSVLIIQMGTSTRVVPVAVAVPMCCLMWGIGGGGVEETMAYAASMSMCFLVLLL